MPSERLSLNPVVQGGCSHGLLSPSDARHDGHSRIRAPSVMKVSAQRYFRSFRGHQQGIKLDYPDASKNSLALRLIPLQRDKLTSAGHRFPEQFAKFFVARIFLHPFFFASLSSAFPRYASITFGSF